jgi:glyoxylase-like metal-dependent hydrolase (beta-lactamase superfamily II)
MSSAQTTQNHEPSPKSSREGVLSMELVKTGLYEILGGGGNSLVCLSAGGLILVDGKLPGNYEALLKQVNRVSKQPVWVVIVTDHDESNTGNDAKFLEAGAAILAQQNTAPRLPAYSPPGGKVAPPVITYDHEYNLKVGGIEAQLLHFGNAHTNGDTVVYFTNLKVVAVGDLFSPTPNPDFSAGGSLVDWGPVLGQVLKLDFDVVVPSMGPAVSRADLEEFKRRIDTVVSRAIALVKKGVPKEQLMAKLKTDDLGWQLNFTQDQVDHFYAELSRAQ